MKQVLSLDINPKTNAIFSNPIKSIAQLKFAEKIQVDIMTFDNEDELVKIANNFPSARLILRIRIEDSTESIKQKYGCQMADVRTLLGRAKNLHLNVVGVSFNVECFQSSNANLYVKGICYSLQVFKIAKSEFDYEFQILNIGGKCNHKHKTNRLQQFYCE